MAVQGKEMGCLFQYMLKAVVSVDQASKRKTNFSLVQL